MGVDPKSGRSPICPEVSRFVPICPLLSRFVLGLGPKKDKRGRGQNGIFWDKWGNAPFRIYPYLALLENHFDLHESIRVSRFARTSIFDWSDCSLRE